MDEDGCGAAGMPASEQCRDGPVGGPWGVLTRERFFADFSGMEEWVDRCPLRSMNT